MKSDTRQRCVGVCEGDVVVGARPVVPEGIKWPYNVVYSAQHVRQVIRLSRQSWAMTITR
ncbi:hypothetical protein J6590_028767 [Homalodisca vitripennis]|nr:hypothetical protein J6590_028767 [Homalodisca vitripennis]